LHQERVDIAEQLLLDIRVSVRETSQVRYRDAQCVAGNRHEASIGGALDAEHGRHTDKTEPSDHCDLDGSVALRPHEQRCNAALDEVDVLNGVVVVLKNRPALQRDGLQEGAKSLEGRRRKSGQQAVLDPNRLLAVSPAQRTFQRYPMELSSRRVPIGLVQPASGLLPRQANPSSIRSHWHPTIRGRSPTYFQLPERMSSKLAAQSVHSGTLASLISAIETYTDVAHLPLANAGPATADVSF